MEKKISVGLDIGTTKIVAMIGRKNEYGKIDVLGIGRAKSVGVKRGVVKNITKTIESIKQVIEEAESISGKKIKNVFLGIAGQHIKSLHQRDYITRENYGEVISELDIDKLMGQAEKLSMLPGEKVIHISPQEFKVDNLPNIKEPIGMYGKRLEADFHVVVGKEKSIEEMVGCVKSAGLNMVGITLEPLASSDSVLSYEEKKAGVALIDMGGGTTDLAIFKDGIIRHTAIIPFGGNVITSDIEYCYSITDVQAELLKVKYGSAWPGENKENELISVPGIRGRDPKQVNKKKLSKVINARVTEIIKQVHTEIENYKRNSPRGELIAGVVLTGGGAKLKHLRQLVELVTGLDTRIGYPNEYLAGDSGEEISSPEYATAVGLLMNGLEKQIDKEHIEQEINEEKNTEKQDVAKRRNIKLRTYLIEKIESKFNRFKEFLDNAE